jgi:metal-responsive CopG/Arc/MetJ family transcriptional regulator
MPANPRQQQFSISLDPALVEQLDQLTDDRDQAIAEALQLWCQRQTEAKLQRSSNFHRQRHDNDEVGWLV